MKVILVYNSHSSKELDVLERAKREMGAYVQEFSVSTVDEAKEKYPVRATPALILLRDDLEGENLIGETVNGELIMSAFLKQQCEQEEQVMYNQSTNRLDKLIDTEKQSAIDSYTLELIEGGLL